MTTKIYAEQKFETALEFLKAGHRISREGWNGARMWLYLVPGNSYQAQTDAARAHFGEMVPYRPYIALVTTANDVVPWCATQSDLLASDWIIYRNDKR